MIIRGTKTEPIDIDVEPYALINAVVGLIQTKFNDGIPGGKDGYVDKDGYWWVYSGHDYHKNESMYKKDRMATVEEIELRNVALWLVKFSKDM